MKKKTKQHVFFVDDEPAVRKSVRRTLERVKLKVSCFACGKDCLEQLYPGGCDLLITDVRMPGMDGIELLKKAKRMVPWLPVLVITGYGDVKKAVMAMKSGASDFIEKPLDRTGFLSVVKSILEKEASSRALLDVVLTPTEIKVLRFILDGKTNREIAIILHRHIRTIEFHRRNIYRKLKVKTLLDLIRRVAEMGGFDPPQNTRN